MIYSQSFFGFALRKDSSKANSRGGRRPYIPAHLLVMSHQVFVDKMLSMLRIYPRGNRGQKKQDRYSGSVRRFHFSQKAILFSFTTICLRFC